MLFPAAVISQRTAIELKPTPDGSVFISGAYPRTLELPGVTVRMVRGPGPVEGDVRYGNGLWLASPARAFLECARGTRSPRPHQGLERFSALDSPLARAAFMMFLIAEVHPFGDGNGRLARVMMNAELIAGGQQRIIIPTAYRDDYLGALRALSRNTRAEVLPKMLDYAQLFTSRIDFSDLTAARRDLERALAFREPSQGRLLIP